MLEQANVFYILKSALIVFVVGLYGVSTVSAQITDIRLRNGSRASQGRLEVYHDGYWGTVCDDGFDSNAAAVVCRMLGYTGNLFVAREHGAFGSGFGQIWLDDVKCQGNETSLLDCRLKPWGQGNCRHTEDVGVDCEPNLVPKVPVRLVGGSSMSEGRVEVQHNGQWGTVCDDNWDGMAAQVVCNQLNMKNTIPVPISGGYFGNGIGNIWLDNIKCTGQENSLGACTHRRWGAANCGHNEDAGVMCLPPSSALSQTQVRLVGGSSSSEGLVQIRLYNRWGTICHDSFGIREATIICRMLGIQSGGQPLYNKKFDVPDRGPIWLDDVSCHGNETSIVDCRHKSFGISNCVHNDDVSVDCTLDSHIKVRLQNGSRRSEGRLEVFYNGVWGTVCDDHFDRKAAAVACHMLGFTGGLYVARGNGFYGAGTGQLWLDDVTCHGNETSLLQCKKKPWGQGNCRHDEDVGVDCQPNLSPALPVRLINGTSKNEGRVEVQHNGQWGTVCDDHWDDKAAQVVCKQLNMQNAVAIPLRLATHGRGEGNIWLASVECTGQETHLGECGYKPWGVNTCSHREDAGVMCVPETSQKQIIRLKDGVRESQGRVEVFYLGTWGTVCEDNFDNKAASVVCRMLGYTGKSAIAVKNGIFGSGTGPIWLDVSCSGNETSLFYCNKRSLGSTNCYLHNSDTGVDCQSADPGIIG